LYGSEVWVVGKNDNIENNHFLAQVSYCHHWASVVRPSVR
jgi:hypothetical protein